MENALQWSVPIVISIASLAIAYLGHRRSAKKDYVEMITEAHDEQLLIFQKRLEYCEKDNKKLRDENKKIRDRLGTCEQGRKELRDEVLDLQRRLLQADP